jgi:hypothetical protein
VGKLGVAIHIEKGFGADPYIIRA